MAGSVGRDRAFEATAESAQLVAQPNPEHEPPRPQVQARPAASAPVRRLERGLSLPLRGADRHASPEQSRAPLVVASNAEPARQERGRSPQPRGSRPASPVYRAPELHESRRRWEEYQRDLRRRDRRYRSPQRSPEKQSPRRRSPHQRSPHPSPPRRGRGAHAGRWESRRREPSPPRPQSAGSGGRRGRRNNSARGGGSRGQGSAADRAGNMVADAVREVQAAGAAAHVHVSVTTEPPAGAVAVDAAPLRSPTLREYLPAAAARGPFRGRRLAPGFPAPLNSVGHAPGLVAAFSPRGVPTAPLPSRAGRDPTLMPLTRASLSCLSLRVHQAITIVQVAGFGGAADALGGASYNPLTNLINYLADEDDETALSLLLRLPAQAGGMVIGAMLTWTFIPDSLKHTVNGPALPPGVSVLAGATAEFTLTFLLFLVVMWTLFLGPSSDRLKEFIMVSATIVAIAAGMRFSGPSLNPLFSIGWVPMLDQDMSAMHWMFYRAALSRTYLPPLLVSFPIPPLSPPAGVQAFGWVYTLDQEMSVQHFIVYWAAPTAGAVLAAAFYRIYLKPHKAALEAKRRKEREGKEGKEGKAGERGKGEEEALRASREAKGVAAERGGEGLRKRVGAGVREEDEDAMAGVNNGVGEGTNKAE
ncbi:unnamed protein product [Closterium sp. Naga37s-1]|nr:unnamed protein product [Closterium sp. Naga37s-1]